MVSLSFGTSCDFWVNCMGGRWWLQMWVQIRHVVCEGDVSGDNICGLNLDPGIKYC